MLVLAVMSRHPSFAVHRLRDNPQAGPRCAELLTVGGQEQTGRPRPG